MQAPLILDYEIYDEEGPCAPYFTGRITDAEGRVICNAENEERAVELVDYVADLLASHNALRHNTKVIIKAYRENRKELDELREAVAWERETDNCGEWLHIAWWDNPKIDLLDIWDIHHAARAEVDRMLEEK